MNSLYITIGAVLTSVVLAVGTTWYVMNNRVERIQADHTLELTQRDLAVSEAQNELKDYKLDFVTRLSESKDNINEGYEKNIDAITRNVAALRGIRLQDPSRPSVPGTPGNSGASGSGSEAGTGDGLLSEEASNFLYDFAGESDEIVEGLRACQLWNSEVKAAVEEHNRKVEELRSRR